MVRSTGVISNAIFDFLKKEMGDDFNDPEKLAKVLNAVVESGGIFGDSMDGINKYEDKGGENEDKLES